MPRDLTAETDREERLNAVLLTYLEAHEAGREPDRDEFLTAHADLRPDLEAFLAGQDEVERLAVPRRGSVPSRNFGFEWHDAPGASRPSLGQLGDFRLLREVGRGGMGVVYEAEQISLHRRVALKVLPFAAAIDPRLLQRFKTEALAAAHVQHEKIVPVHAIGCERGVHYYAMQFIEGQSLAALISELRRRGERNPRPLMAPWKRGADLESREPSLSLNAPEPGEAASLTAETISREWSSDSRCYFERVAGLGWQAALALEHAHQAGIVHRDIKPSNLLLDLREQLWVTDFGLAQVTGDAGLTMTGELLGTLRYASPEQILARRGIVDHRSDIYSLGATLYELLTLRPLFEGRDRNELLRQIADDEPPAPRSLDATVPSDLETIVLKALRKEPGDRYATAQELADDLERFLDRRPIVARRPTPAERLRTWARRHPSIVAACGLVLILLSIASLISTVLIRREQGRTWVAQQKAESAYRHERQRAEEAETRFRLARRSVDELIQVSEEELAHRPGMEGLRKRLLTSALAYYQEFIAQRHNDPDAQAALRDTTRRVETILDDLAVLRAAGQLYLLAQSAAHDDLGLDDEQRAKVKELSGRAGRRWVETMSDMGRLSPAERGRWFLDTARANEAQINAILTPAQQFRLRQIALQAEGSGAFREPEVTSALGLSPEQRAEIRAIQDEAFWRLRSTRQGSSRDDASPKLKPMMERILAVLTEEQVRRWREMTGEPLKGSLSPFPAPFNAPREPRRSAR